MDDLVREVIPLLQYLIPGFLAAWIFYSLTAFKRPDSFGQIVQALIFTFVIHGVVATLGWGLMAVGDRFFSVGYWNAVAQSLCSFLVAVSLGLGSCYIANNDSLHRLLRNSKITSKTSYSSEWFSAFAGYRRFIVLHLWDERRLYGWPSEWPSDPSAGQFVMQEPSWLDDKGDETPLKAEVLLIDVAKVQWIEFSPPQLRTAK
ncbi:DUF6338 family protein [Pseudomonas turukhanskensis]|uniref:Prophage PssSM-03 n=1 Tax=Pseudomonas turukhanskensis TaxID=1806536 RepID=A0A9W6K0N1_9PSED|nr:DUF6338 family protein [Pseudomonas turukhanskensis]GLK87331.1 hypothetical protein GCM10017655_03930 [Pseudomonas turukhanskensis]